MITNEDLIPLVYSKPEIWDQNSLHYTNKEVKMKTWNDIAEKLNVTGKSEESLFLIDYDDIDFRVGRVVTSDRMRPFRER